MPDTLEIQVSMDEYNKGVELMKGNPSYEDWENLLGQERALKILSATHHEIPVQLVTKGMMNDKING